MAEKMIEMEVTDAHRNIGFGDFQEKMLKQLESFLEMETELVLQNEKLTAMMVRLHLRHMMAKQIEQIARDAIKVWLMSVGCNCEKGQKGHLDEWLEDTQARAAMILKHPEWTDKDVERNLD